MKYRKYLIQVHLCLAALFIPYLILMPVTGTLYLMGYKGSAPEQPVFELELAQVPETPQEVEDFFRGELQNQGMPGKFEYITKKGHEYIFRPTTQNHYIARVNESLDKVQVSLVKPSLLKKLIELHKGHGPQISRVYEMVFGVALLLVSITGVCLAFLTSSHRRLMLGFFSGGVVLLFFVLL